MLIIYFLLYLLNPLLSYNINNIISNRLAVNLHLEKFNERYNLLHIGISFNDNNDNDKNIRFDFRPFNKKNGYITTNLDKTHFSNIFPELKISNNFEEMYTRYKDVVFDTDEMQTRDILWGYTNYTFNDIIKFEKTLHRNYKLGIYDCRHYVNRFTKWSLDKPTPIWSLNKLWDEVL